MIITYLTAMAAGLAVIYLLLGPKIISNKSKSVRVKDQRLETKALKKSSNDLIITLAGSVLSSGVTYAITGNLIFTSIALAGGFLVLKWYHNKKERERKELLQEQFAEVLGQIESALYGGLNPYQAIEDAVPEMPRPAKDIFYEILRHTRSGDTLAQAIEAVRKESGWEELRVLSIAMNLYSRTGCNMGEICRSALESYEDEDSFRRQIKASIAQNMFSVKLLTALPFLVLGAARTIAPAFTAPLFNTFEGGVVFIILTSWIIIGNIFIEKMVVSALGKNI
ncbi:Flp pilus assembly protein TadB [Desulfotomaculum arcticum]|uniref:Flp pilus assembly protein TadB n=1 Tax=Desulfotruncus arcticus DSM 17038 TaxID=1121424 RepID=A0A1I2ZAX4_9FIRM|nr:type II secretion system F family protein [Desulfotruncus arcticus]SFH34241.1 Flp pilus assembly protein TadB [Desulfotomaculum arcticum] [Desulfotruncus arcticus DSM 17038]